MFGGWPAGRWRGRMAGCLAGWFVGWLVSWLAGWLVCPGVFADVRESQNETCGAGSARQRRGKKHTREAEASGAARTRELGGPLQRALHKGPRHAQQHRRQVDAEAVRRAFGVGVGEEWKARGLVRGAVQRMRPEEHPGAETQASQRRRGRATTARRPCAPRRVRPARSGPRRDPLKQPHPPRPTERSAPISPPLVRAKFASATAASQSITASRPHCAGAPSAWGLGVRGRVAGRVCEASAIKISWLSRTA